jgi:hypothetical protein
MKEPNKSIEPTGASRSGQLQYARQRRLAPAAHAQRWASSHAMRQFDRSKSLQQLEGKDWGEPTFDSHLVTECHRLHRIPLRDFTIEDLRITVGQDIGLEYLVPLALERLQENPFAEGAYYPCDLLVNVLGSDAKYWQSHPDHCKQLVAIAERAIETFPTVPDIASKTVTKAVTRAYDEFKKRQKSMA